ncbi:CBN-REF-1 protein [Caenorhabditis brenneri]|uniref:CBN-REF-1 protein n=1 Tax=Caenorhabditis brenneri TaxID=135651 RepID=G0NLR0_CAEBE|nr:CBN-REF-1 protein [Caenorhabditis brenneri]
MVLLTPPANMFSRKTTQEKKRRDEINAKIKELQELIQGDSDQEKMTQSDTLNRAVELVNRMESETPGPSTNPNRKGFFDGYATIENLTYSFIKSLGVNTDVCQEFIQRAKQCFDRERSSLLMSTPGKYRKAKSEEKEHLEIPSTYSQSSSTSPSTSEPGTSMDRKEVKKNREQDRRDRQGEAFDALKNFIIENKLMSSLQVEKMQRLNTLDIIIGYIRNKKNNFVSKNGQEQSLYAHANMEGQKTARLVAFQFFKSDRHLTVRCADLEKFFDFSLNPKPLLGFPRLPIPMPLPFPSLLAPPMMNPFLPFPFLPLPAMPISPKSPAYSLDSPPPSSDTSTSSIEVSTPKENAAVVMPVKPATPPVVQAAPVAPPTPVVEKQIFRPWE